ncbi:MAG: hypothetical protein Q9165_005829 [Trypethelium subeluteriae]
MLGKRGHSDFEECSFGFQAPGKLFNQETPYNASETLPFRFSASPESHLTVTPGADDMMTPMLARGEHESSMPTESLAFPRGWRSPSPSGSGDLPDLEMDDDDNDSDVDIVGSQPPQSPRPWARPTLPLSRLSLPHCPSANECNQLGGRIPTPIYSTFNMGSPGAPPKGLGISSKPAPLNLIHINRLRIESDRPLPSPIKEDLNSPARLTANQFSKLGVHDEDEEMQMDSPGLEPISPGLRSGRARSGAFTEKKRFAMGYRSDCVKCQTRVPGHFSHFLSDST